MKFLIYNILFILGWSSFGQLTIVPIEQYNSSNLRKIQNDTIYTLDLPFWDDFSTSQNQPDTLKWSIGKDVFVNETLGKNPPTYKLATFDGLLQNGSAHAIASNFSGAADSLITHYIDLSKIAASKRNSVYLSFYWQARGNGEIPDETDSLRVQFLNTDLEWVTQWVQIGGLDNVHDQFTQELVPVRGDEFFHNKFMIKFQSFASLKGPYDTWHIDYVYLNENRTSASTSHFDRSLTGSITSLFGKYYEMPAQHFFRNQDKYLTQQSVMASNLDASAAVGHPLEYYYQLKNLTTDEIYNFTNMGNGGLGGLSPLEYRNILGPDTSVFNLAPNQLDSQVFETTFYYLTNDKNLFEEVNGTDTLFLPVDLKVNDSIRSQFTLNNYYAYDDGSAEFSVAINVVEGEVAIRYILEEADTLTDIDIYFPNIAPDPSGSEVDVIVWDELTDSRIISRQSHTIQVPDGINSFSRIRLNNPVLVRDTIYIGYRQFVDRYLGIGFDRNNSAASTEIFSKITDTWEQNTRLSGALMIRPVFGYDSAFILHTPKITSFRPMAYPNPSKGAISIREPYDQLQIFNLSGALVYESKKLASHEISFLEDGIFLLCINSKNHIYTQKLILKNE